MLQEQRVRRLMVRLLSRMVRHLRALRLELLMERLKERQKGRHSRVQIRLVLREQRLVRLTEHRMERRTWR